MARKYGVGYKRFKVLPGDIIQPDVLDIAQAIEAKVEPDRPTYYKPKRKGNK